MVRSGTIDPEVSKFWSKKKKKVSDVNRPGQDRGSQGVAGRSLSDVCFLSTSVGAADMAAGKQSPYSERACFCSVFSWGYWKGRCVVKYERPKMGLFQRDFNGMGLFRKGNRDVHLRGEALASWRVSRVSVLSVLQCVDDFTDSTWSGCRELQVADFMG